MAMASPEPSIGHISEERAGLFWVAVRCGARGFAGAACFACGESVWIGEGGEVLPLGSPWECGKVLAPRFAITAPTWRARAAGDLQGARRAFCLSRSHETPPSRTGEARRSATPLQSTAAQQSAAPGSAGSWEYFTPSTPRLRVQYENKVLGIPLPY